MEQQQPRLPRALEVGLLSLMLCSLALASVAAGRAVGNARHAGALPAALYVPLGMDDDAGVDDDLTRPDDYVSNGKAEKTAKVLARRRAATSPGWTATRGRRRPHAPGRLRVERQGEVRPPGGQGGVRAARHGR